MSNDPPNEAKMQFINAPNSNFSDLEFLFYLPQEVIDNLIQWDDAPVCIPKYFKQYIDSVCNNNNTDYKDLFKGILLYFICL